MEFLTHRLSHSGYTAAIAPGAGGCLLSLSRNGLPLLRSAPSAAACARDARVAAHFCCAPYFGRLYEGLTVDGQRFSVGPTSPVADANMPLHGEGWVHPWVTTSKEDHTLTCRLAYTPQRIGGFPFRFTAEQKFTLSQNGLNLFLSIENTDQSAFPAGLGLHPFFERRPETTVKFSAAEFWSPPAGAEGAPTSRPDPLGGGAFASLPETPRDDSYIFDPPSVVDAKRQLFVDQRDIVIGMEFSTDALHIFAPPNEPYFCAEPITHAPGRLLDVGARLGGRLLSPGARLSMEMRLFGLREKRAGAM